MTISAGIKEALESESGVPEMNRWKSRQLSEAVRLFLIAVAWCAYYLGREHERRTPRT